MARLRVGQISIDGANVTIGDAPAAARTETQPKAPPPASLGAAAALVGLPVRPAVLVGVGAVLGTLGLVLGAVFRAWADPVGALVHGAALAPLGLGFFGLGVAKLILARNPRLLHGAALGGDPTRYVAALAKLLARAEPHQSVEWIVERTGWSEVEAVHALALLRSEGLLIEDVDLDTGRFFYHVLPKSVDSRSLDTRLRSLPPRGDRR